MTDWIKRLQDQRVKEGADVDIEQQKYDIAVQATPRLASMLLAQIKTDVADFKKVFSGDRIELVIPDPMGDDLRVRCQRFPLLTVRYTFAPAQLQYIKQRMEMHDSPLMERSGTVFVRGEFNQSCWYQHEGQKIMTTEELSKMLLAELFEEASK